MKRILTTHPAYVLTVVLAVGLSLCAIVSAIGAR
jgi:hypothetical protein